MEFNEFDVRQELKRLGYRLGSCTGKAFILTKAGGKPRQYDNVQRQLRMGDGITVPDLVRIMRTSGNAIEAARRCEAVCLGQPDPYQGAPSADEISQRVQSGVKSVLEELGLTPELIASLKQKTAVAPPVEPPPVAAEKPPPYHQRRPGPGRPKGSKNKPKAQEPPIAV